MRKFSYIGVAPFDKKMSKTHLKWVHHFMMRVSKKVTTSMTLD